MATLSKLKFWQRGTQSAAAPATNGNASNVVQFPGAGNQGMTTVSSDELIKRTMVEASQLTDIYESPMDKSVHALFALLAYAGPLIVAIAAGWWIGDGYAGPFKWQGDSAGVHIISFFGELALAMLTLTCARIIKRSANDRAMWKYLAVTGLVLLVFSAASATAQWFLILNNIRAAGYDPSQMAVIVMLAFRVVMPLGIDIAALLYLSIHGYRSLRQKLAQIDERGEAFEKIHVRMLAMQEREDKARRDREDAEAERARRKAAEETLNHIMEMQSNAAIAQLEKALDPNIVDSSRSFRR